MRTIVYIDGYNLFYGCLKHSSDKWLDIVRLFKTIIHAQNPDSVLTEVKFFTADIRAKLATHGQDAQHAQANYHRALELLYPGIIKIVKGYYSAEKANLLAFQNPPDKSNRVAVWKLEEKQTDVNLALEAYRDAARNHAEQFVFVSNDTDIATSLRLIRQDFNEHVKIGVILPIRKSVSGRPGNTQLSQFADWTRTSITDDELSNHHLPAKIPTKKKPILKPGYW